MRRVPYEGIDAHRYCAAVESLDLLAGAVQGFGEGDPLGEDEIVVFTSVAEVRQFLDAEEEVGNSAVDCLVPLSGETQHCLGPIARFDADGLGAKLHAGRPSIAVESLLKHRTTLRL
jgi:hypothetical protein